MYGAGTFWPAPRAEFARCTRTFQFSPTIAREPVRVVGQGVKCCAIEQKMFIVVIIVMIITMNNRNEHNDVRYNER